MKYGIYSNVEPHHCGDKKHFKWLTTSVEKKRNETNPNQSPGFFFFLQPSAICRRNVWCPTWVSIEIKYRHYPCHNCKHNYSNSDDVNAQTSFHLKEWEKKAETYIKTLKKVFKMLKIPFRDFHLKLTMSITVKWPYENTMALAGFATGSRNAKEVHKVAGIKMKSGFTWMASAYHKIKEREQLSRDTFAKWNA